MKTKNGKCSVAFYLVYSLPMIGYCLVVALLGYVSYFAVNVLGLSSLLVGNLILVSKIFDGISDVIAGFLIDHTNTKFGRARPYDWAYVGFCLSAVLLFCIPQMKTAATAVCLFLTYMLIYTVFQTLYSCAQAVYLARTVSDADQQVSVNVVSMLIGIVGSVVAGVFIPVYIARMGNDAAAWRTFAVALGIPSAIICSIRFFIIKENTDIQAEGKEQQKINFKEGVQLLARNPYILIIALALLVVNIATNLAGANPFFFDVVLGDLSAQSVVNAVGAVGPLSVIFFPLLAKKIGKKKLIIASLILGIVGKLLPLLNLHNVVLLGIGTALGTIGYMPLYVLTVNIIIECMDYGEWKFGKRGEGIYSCISGFTSKIGTGLGNWMVGFIMALGGYSSQLAVQSQGAKNSIILLFTVIPALLYLIAAVAVHFYRLEEQLPLIQTELCEKKNKDVAQIGDKS